MINTPEQLDYLFAISKFNVPIDEIGLIIAKQELMLAKDSNV